MTARRNMNLKPETSSEDPNQNAMSSFFSRKRMQNRKGKEKNDKNEGSIVVLFVRVQFSINL